MNATPDPPLQVLFGGADLVVDASGPDPIVVVYGDSLHADVADEPLVLQFQAAGVPGRDGADLPVQAVASDDLPVGTPVAIDRATGKFIAADAAFKPAAFVVGLLAEVAVAGFIANAAPARLTLPDWSAVTGAAQLRPGQPYFLAAGGGLSTDAPASECVVMVGRALNPTTLLINPQPPIER